MIARPPSVPPGSVRVLFAANQPPYEALPAVLDLQAGTVMTEWEFTAEDLAKVLAGGRVRLWIWTFGIALQPVAIEVIE